MARIQPGVRGASANATTWFGSSLLSTSLARSWSASVANRTSTASSSMPAPVNVTLALDSAAVACESVAASTTTPSVRVTWIASSSPNKFGEAMIAATSTTPNTIKFFQSG